MGRPLASGEIVIARFPEHVPPGREQHGVRPALVMGLPERLGRPRFPVVLVSPLTTDPGQGWATDNPRLYRRLSQGMGGLPSPSVVLLDQTRFLSIHRIVSWLGRLEPEWWGPIREGMVDLLHG